MFENVRKELGYNKTAVAHHKDDQAETVLFQLIRGSGIRGLGGMKPENGSIIRPLLDIRRMEIEEALKAEGISYCTDSTNENNNYARNMLRNNIIPYIEDNIQPAVVERLWGLQNSCRIYIVILGGRQQHCIKKLLHIIIIYIWQMQKGFQRLI